MLKIYGLFYGLAALLLPAADPNPDPSNPAGFFPSGPNFGFFSGLQGTVRLIIGIGLVIIFFTGVILFFGGLRKFRLKDPETGRAAKGLVEMISGAILAVGAFITVPILLLLITLGQATAPQIK